MQLKDHPSLHIWPPSLLAAFESEPLSSEESEESILKAIEIKPPYIWIFTEYRMKNYLGGIRVFIDPEFFDLLCQKLRDSIGKTLREIGNSEWEDQVALVLKAFVA